MNIICIPKYTEYEIQALLKKYKNPSLTIRINSLGVKEQLFVFLFFCLLNCRIPCHKLFWMPQVYMKECQSGLLADTNKRKKSQGADLSAKLSFWYLLWHYFPSLSISYDLVLKKVQLMIKSPIFYSTSISLFLILIGNWLKINQPTNPTKQKMWTKEKSFHLSNTKAARGNALYS